MIWNIKLVFDIYGDLKSDLPFIVVKSHAVKYCGNVTIRKDTSLKERENDKKPARQNKTGKLSTSETIIFLTVQLHTKNNN